MGNWHTWLWPVIVVAVAVVVALLVHAVLYALARRLARETKSKVDNSFVDHSSGPVKLLLLLLAAFISLRLLPLSPSIAEPVSHLIALVLIANVAWLLIALTAVADDVVALRYDITKSDNLTARKIQTQIGVLRRIFIVIVFVITLSVMLMTFPTVRRFGESLFASAGLAGLIVGLAARSTLANLIAGFQIALTEPIRIDDVVIVEGEWGRIEEIGSTYVVVAIWDMRRLVVPLSYFIEKPFQNWTRQTAQILGSVFLYVDYNVPVEEVRKELFNYLKQSELWDGEVWGLQVTNASERTVELRALMSAKNSSAAWDLRCNVREHLISFLQQRYPQSLPRVRAEVRTESDNGGTLPASARS